MAGNRQHRRIEQLAAPLISIALSTSAEVAQLPFLPNRSPTLADLAASAAGALIGTHVVLATRGLLPHLGSQVNGWS